MIFALVMAVWGGGYKFLLLTDRHVKGPEMDLFDSGYIWYLFVCRRRHHHHLYLFSTPLDFFPLVTCQR